MNTSFENAVGSDMYTFETSMRCSRLYNAFRINWLKMPNLTPEATKAVIDSYCDRDMTLEIRILRVMGSSVRIHRPERVTIML